HFHSAAAWLQGVRRIDWQRTVGELGALLTEARLVKQLAPLHNRQLRRPGALCGFVFDGKRLRLASAAEIDADTLPFVYGVFRTRRATRPKCTRSTAGAISAPRAANRRWRSSSTSGRASITTSTASSRATWRGPGRASCPSLDALRARNTRPVRRAAGGTAAGAR